MPVRLEARCARYQTSSRAAVRVVQRIKIGWAKSNQTSVRKKLRCHAADYSDNTSKIKTKRQSIQMLFYIPIAGANDAHFLWA